MEKQLIQKHDELQDKLRKYDETILELLKQGHKKLIIQIIKDYLSSCE